MGVLMGRALAGSPRSTWSFRNGGEMVLPHALAQMAGGGQYNWAIRCRTKDA
jgi:hypothetical protein